MHVQSVLSLSKVADDKNEAGDLAIAHITKDRGRPEFRRHAWLVLTYLIDFYMVMVPRRALISDMHSLASSLIDCAKEMEASHG